MLLRRLLLLLLCFAACQALLTQDKADLVGQNC